MELVESSFDSIDSDGFSTQDPSLDDDALVEATRDGPNYKLKSLANVYERCNLLVVEPNSYCKASESANWVAAMKAEMEMINKNDTWELVEQPQGKNIISVKWVFRVKYNFDGSINKYKARLMVKGYAQQPGVDYGDTFAPVA